MICNLTQAQRTRLPACTQGRGACCKHCLETETIPMAQGISENAKQA